MQTNPFLLFVVVALLASMILFSATVPVYASHTKKSLATDDENRLFDKIFTRLQNHDGLIETRVDDVKESFSEPVEIFFSCRQIVDRAVQSVTISVSTELVGFDEGLALKHGKGKVGAVYVWECRAVMDSFTLTIECTNMLMLNPEFVMREETETRQKRIIALMENEATLYHELLHGQLMINAMSEPADALGWRADACTFFDRNNNAIDFSASDAQHETITLVENGFLSKLVEMNNGKLLMKTVSSESASGGFTQVIAKFEELGDLADSSMYVFARTRNIADSQILISRGEEAISISGRLQDAGSDGLVKLFVMPKLKFSNARIELSVDDSVKTTSSEFVFTARIWNLATIDTPGSITLFIDGRTVASKQLFVQAGKTLTLPFTWVSDSARPSLYSAQVDGFNGMSNKVTVKTFERVVSSSTREQETIREQTLTDPLTGEDVLVARLERISATVMRSAAGGGDPERENDVNLRLFAPDGTLVVGEEGLVDAIGKKAKLVEVDGQKLLVQFKDLNSRLVFLAVKSSDGGPLPAGEWLMKRATAPGDDGGGDNSDVKIKYFARYIKLGA